MSAGSEEPLQVWSVQLGQGRERLREAWRLLSERERERAHAFISRSAAEEFVLARAALRRILGASLDVRAEQVALAAGLLGKPTLVQPSALSFSVSHGGGLIVVAVGRAVALGIDVEPRHENPQRGLALAERFFAREEVEILRALARDKLADALARLWSRKEAYVKALGIGLRVPLSSFALTVTGPPRVLRCAPGDPIEPSSWHLTRLRLRDGLHGTLAAVGPPLPKSIRPVTPSSRFEHLGPAPLRDRLGHDLAVAKALPGGAPARLARRGALDPGAGDLQ